MSDHGITGTGRRRSPVLIITAATLGRKRFRAVQKRAHADGISFQREFRKLINMGIALS